MKIKLSSAFFVLVFLVSNIYLLASNAFAQREVSDYNYQYDQYRQFYTQYQTAKNEYLTYKTLTSQQEAVKKTQAILLQRAQVMRTYFYALRYKLNTTEGVDLTERSQLSASLDNEIGWLQNHMDDVSSLQNPSLSQLFEISARLEQKADDHRVLGSQALATILIGKVRQTHQRFVTLNNIYQPYINQTANAGYLKNWLSEAQSNGFAALQSLQRAEAGLEGLKNSGSNSGQIDQVIRAVQAECNTAQRQLQKGIGFQKEIVRELSKHLVAVTPTTQPQMPSAINTASGSSIPRFGILKQIQKTETGYQIQFDEAQWLTGAAAVEKYKEDQQIPKEDTLQINLPNGFYIHNPSSEFQTLQLSAGATLSILNPDNTVGEAKPIETFSALFPQMNASPMYADLVITSNLVQSITQHYVP